MQQYGITAVTAVEYRNGGITVENVKDGTLLFSSAGLNSDESDFPTKPLASMQPADVDVAALEQHRQSLCGSSMYSIRASWTYDRTPIENVSCNGSHTLVNGKEPTAPTDPTSAETLKGILALSAGMAPKGQVLDVDLNGHKVTVESASPLTGGTCWYPQFTLPVDKASIGLTSEGISCQPSAKPTQDLGWDRLKAFTPASVDPAKASAAFTKALAKAGSSGTRAKSCYRLEISDSTGKGPDAVAECTAGHTVREHIG